MTTAMTQERTQDIHTTKVSQPQSGYLLLFVIALLAQMACSPFSEIDEVVYVEKNRVNDPFGKDSTPPDTLTVRVFPSTQKVVLNRSDTDITVLPIQTNLSIDSADCNVYSQSAWRCWWSRTEEPQGRIWGSVVSREWMVAGDTLRRITTTVVYGGSVTRETTAPVETVTYARMSMLSQIRRRLKSQR